MLTVEAKYQDLRQTCFNNVCPYMSKFCLLVWFVSDAVIASDSLVFLGKITPFLQSAIEAGQENSLVFFCKRDKHY